MKLLAVVIGVVATLALAGCNGGGNHSYPAALDCVEKAPVEWTTSDLDLIAEKAQDGAIKIDWDGNSVTLAFEPSSDAAESVRKQYELFTDTTGVRVEQRANVVVAWDKSPTENQQKVVDDCLS